MNEKEKIKEVSEKRNCIYSIIITLNKHVLI